VKFFSGRIDLSLRVSTWPAGSREFGEIDSALESEISRLILRKSETAQRFRAVISAPPQALETTTFFVAVFRGRPRFQSAKASRFERMPAAAGFRSEFTFERGKLKLIEKAG
jgi:hypothetical protein